MNNFTKFDSLAAVAANSLISSRNETLKEALEGIPSSMTNNRKGIFYIEEPDNIQAINMYIKKFLTGVHIHTEDVINRLFVNLQSIGLIVDGYKGINGTYNVYQHGRIPSEHPVTGSEFTDDIIFLRSSQHAKMTIKKSIVLGGGYMIDAEFYLTKNQHK